MNKPKRTHKKGAGYKNSGKILPVVRQETEPQNVKPRPLTEREKQARKLGFVIKGSSKKPHYAQYTSLRDAVADWQQSKYSSQSFENRTASADITDSTPNSFYSPQLSTDYLQLPKSIEERRAWYRFWFERSEIVARSVELHSTLPLSKIKLSSPRGSDPDTNDYILNFFSRMVDRLNLFQRLLEISHEYWLIGDVFIFFQEGEGIEEYFNIEDDQDEDDLSQQPDKFFYDRTTSLKTAAPEDSPDTADTASPGDIPLSDTETPDVSAPIEPIKPQIKGPQPIPYNYYEQPIKQKPKTIEERLKNLKVKVRNKKYKGWDKILILPPDDVRITTFPFTDKISVELNLNPEARKAFDFRGEPFYSGNRNFAQYSEDILSSIPEEILQHVQDGGLIPLDTDPYQGSFVYHLPRKKSQYEPLGTSILERCQNTLLHIDKLRQAQSQIASRHMTPIRVVWGENLSDIQTEELRGMVDASLEDPDFSIVSNYPITYQEIGSNERLLDLANELEHCYKLLFIGLGVTEELMTGQGTFSGNRVSLEIMNTLYVNYREIITHFIEEIIFKPIAVKKGFYEVDNWGNKVYLYPKISFTRLSLRDNTETYEQLFNLYQKGSVSIDLILELLGIDPEDSKKKVERDIFTVNDPLFNELIRNIYQNMSQTLADKTDITDRLAKYLNLNYAPPQQEENAIAGGPLPGTE